MELIYIELIAAAVLVLVTLVLAFGRRSTRSIYHHLHAFREQNLRDHLFSVEPTNTPDYTFAELRNKLYSGELKPSEVLRQFKAKAHAVQRRLNCITEAIPDCEEVANRLDGLPEAERRKLPLYGIPVSIKENFNVAGTHRTGGLIVHALEGLSTKEKESPIVKLLRDNGAVPFVKTNVPQTLISFDCHNFLYGQTVNPYDEKRVPGGSSGGEAALIGGGGSLLGLGGDIGGSLRIPAVFCGICAIKPTARRLSKRNLCPLLTGQEAILGAAGPMGRDVETVATALRVIFNGTSYPLDPLVPPVPFREQMFTDTRKLRIGYYTQLKDIVHAVPACERAVTVAVEKLRNAGHEIVPFEFDVSQCIPLYMATMVGDSGRQMKAEL